MWYRLISAFIKRYDLNLPIKKDLNHRLVLGSPAKGKSFFDEDNPKIKIVLPTQEQLKLQQERLDMNKELELKRLNAIKECYWNHLDQDFDKYELDVIKYALLNTNLFIDQEPSLEQIKITFMLFDKYIFGQCVSFGFSDTEVRRGIYEFIDENVDIISNALNLSLIVED